MKEILMEQFKIEKTDIDTLYSVFALKKLAEKEMDFDLMYLDNFSKDLSEYEIIKTIGNILDEKRKLTLKILPKISSLEDIEYCNKELIVDQLQYIFDKYFKRIKMINHWWKDSDVKIILNFIDFLQYEIQLSDRNTVLISEYMNEKRDKDPKNFKLNSIIKNIKFDRFMYEFMSFAYNNIHE